VLWPPTIIWFYYRRNVDADPDIQNVLKLKQLTILAKDSLVWFLI
jgi:hypothetical protein